MIFVKLSQNFIKSPLKICHISQISVHSLWHVWKSVICIMESIWQNALRQKVNKNHEVKNKSKLTIKIRKNQTKNCCDYP